MYSTNPLIHILDVSMTTFLLSGRSGQIVSEGASNVKPEGVVQDFNQLRRKCLASRTLFEDPEFPAQDSSVYFSKTPDKPIEWKRPTELVDDPKLFVDGFSRFDLIQGNVHNCWFIVGAADLAMHPELFLHVVPEDQSFQINYAGIFHFRFWQYGKWVDVVVDDRLPTIEGKLMFLRSPEHEEFWGSLLEKAYAKLNGSYEALGDGRPCESMEDFTGGVTDLVDMHAIPSNLYTMLLNAQERNSLMGCTMKTFSTGTESITPEGLIGWHTYSITKVIYVDRKTQVLNEKILLLRLRNPWGKDEWNGQWSDQSSEWNSLSDTEKEELGLKFDVDGEFWIPFHDFKKHFSTIDICNLSPDSLTDTDAGRKNWEISAFEGKWVRGLSAGGCGNFIETFSQNPQYRITLKHPDEGDDKCSVIVALMQKNRRALKSKGIHELLHIGFNIYHLEDPQTLPNPLDENYFENYSEDLILKSGPFYDDREVSRRFKLQPGVYCIVPSTFQPHLEGEFLLRIFSDSYNTSLEKRTESVDVNEVSDMGDWRTWKYSAIMAGYTPVNKKNLAGTFLPPTLRPTNPKTLRSIIKQEYSKLPIVKITINWDDGNHSHIDKVNKS